MDHCAVVSSYLSQMESRELHRLAEKKAKLEYAKLNLSEAAQSAAEKELDQYAQGIVSRIESETTAPASLQQRSAHALA